MSDKYFIVQVDWSEEEGGTRVPITNVLYSWGHRDLEGAMAVVRTVRRNRTVDESTEFHICRVEETH
jgi:hypothetical protein